jgi:glycine cleavage system H protein
MRNEPIFTQYCVLSAMEPYVFEKDLFGYRSPGDRKTQIKGTGMKGEKGMEESNYIVEVDSFRMAIPKNLLFTDSHVWVKPLQNNQLMLGLTEPHVVLLGGIAFLEYQVDESETVSEGELIAILEAYKTTSELKSPISGRVISVNRELPRKTRFIETNPYDKGWLFTLEPENNAQYRNALLEPKAYYELILREVAQRNEGAVPPSSR